MELIYANIKLHVKRVLQVAIAMDLKFNLILLQFLANALFVVIQLFQSAQIVQQEATINHHRIIQILTLLINFQELKTKTNKQQ